MPSLDKLTGQPSSYVQRFSIYEILPFYDHFGLFGSKNWTSVELKALDFFGNK